MTADISISPDTVTSQDIITLLESHLALMGSLSPEGSDHSLDLEGLRSRDVTFWRAEIRGQLAGCAALKQIDAVSGEVKSMHTAADYRGKGIASTLLSHMMTIARERGYEALYLETGTQPGYQSARALYERHGFSECRPFAGYTEDPNSCFMSLDL